ncbi:MAG: enolase C-terminal domain-like protein [Planctomycetota bacterium]
MPRIDALDVFVTRPATENLVVVRLRTDDGRVGLGCATLTQRYAAVVAALESHLRPLLLGRDPARITELWRLMHFNGYWRNGPVLNNAISGVDQALWDLKGKAAGLPVYELLGGKVREAAAVYHHASGATPDELVDAVKQIVERGVRHVRCQIAANPHTAPDQLAANVAGYGGLGRVPAGPEGKLPGTYFDPVAYRREAVAGLAAVRDALGDGIELIHDVHSRLPLADAIGFAKDLEPLRLFFLEDALPPEQLDGYPRLRAATTTPLAIGELFASPSEWLPLVQHRWIDFLRCHISAIGGLTPAIRAAQVCEAFGVRTAWHGPKDTSPAGHTAQLHLNVASPAFGIQEFAPFVEAERDIFGGLPELKAGYLYPNDRPGWGLTFDEHAAVRFPPRNDVIAWTQARLPDGSLTAP